MLTVGKLYIIDYEYGSHSYRGYDIANYFNEHAGFDCDYSLYVSSVGCFPICCGSSWAAEVPTSSSLFFKDMIIHTSKLEYVHDSLLIRRVCNNNETVLSRSWRSAILRNHVLKLLFNFAGTLTKGSNSSSSDITYIQRILTWWASLDAFFLEMLSSCHGLEKWSTFFSAQTHLGTGYLSC